MEWATDKVRVIDVAPGYIATDLNADYRAKDEVQRWIKRRIPVARAGEPQEVARLRDGARVVMTRTTMDAVDLHLRSVIARRANAHALISVHLNAFGDGTDCVWRPTLLTNTSTLPYITDNPRVENLWQYLKRRYNYRAGIVSTAAITDATPAVEGSYVGYRQARLEIAKHYRENPMLNGRPAFDVILGGGRDPFTAAGRGVTSMTFMESSSIRPAPEAATSGEYSSGCHRR